MSQQGASGPGAGAGAGPPCPPQHRVRPCIGRHRPSCHLCKLLQQRAEVKCSTCVASINRISRSLAEFLFKSLVAGSVFLTPRMLCGWQPWLCSWWGQLSLVQEDGDITPPVPAAHGASGRGCAAACRRNPLSLLAGLVPQVLHLQSLPVKWTEPGPPSCGVPGRPVPPAAVVSCSLKAGKPEVSPFLPACCVVQSLSSGLGLPPRSAAIDSASSMVLGYVRGAGVHPWCWGTGRAVS